MDFLKRLDLNPGQKVGDFGAGALAAWARYLSHLVGQSGEVLMFEVKKTALQSALAHAQIHRLGNCRGVWTNLEVYRGAQGIADNTLDAGLMADLLSESKHQREIMTEIHRMLKPGAKLLITDWKIDTHFPVAPAKQMRVPAEYVTDVAKAAGFTELEKFEVDANHWGLLLLKN